MKKILLLIAFSKQSFAFAQNVGIGTASPAFRLDVVGSVNTDSVYRIGGNTVLSVKEAGNTFLGIASGIVNTSGSNNTAIGYAALSANASGTSNSAFGAEALRLNNSGSQNTAAGFQALYSNTSGYMNVSHGYQSLFSNTSGRYNSAHGVFALYHNTTGSFNVASGHQTLNWNTTGDYNAAIGYLALFNNTEGHDNTGIGRLTLSLSTTGYGNTAIGSTALQGTRTSSLNTAVGFNAGDSYDNGYNNTFLGADADANADGYYNAVAIGNAARVTAPNQVRIGNSSTVSIGGFKNWTTLSDGRFKQNIREEVIGLDFIMKLKPVTYTLDVAALRKQLNENGGTKQPEDNRAQTLHTGFVAQQVEQAAKEAGFDFSGVDKPKNQNDFYGLRYAEFVVPLVKAVQEQQTLIQKQQQAIAALEEALKRQGSLLTELKARIMQSGNNK